MKHLFYLSFILLFCLSAKTVFAQSYEVHISDVLHFWEAYDAVHAESDSAVQVQLIRELYVDRGTEGLRDFMKVRGGNAAFWQQMMTRDRDFCETLRPRTENLLQQKPMIDEKLAVFRDLYPDFRDADVYFTIGKQNSGGTVTDDKVLIGCEVMASARNDWAVPIVLHEFVHTQQNNNSNGHLLAHSIYEGMADFISEIVWGQSLTEYYPERYIALGLKHEVRIWEAFKTEMMATDAYTYFGWMYGGGGKPFSGKAVNDYGYFLGYRICQSYYEQASDKKAAISYLLNYDLSTDESARDFLLASGYVPEDDVTYVDTLTFRNIKEVVKGTDLMGYEVTDDHLIFTIDVPEGYDPSLIETVYVAGTFNDWTPQADGYQMTYDGDRNFRLKMPWSRLDGSSEITFKFVVNGSEWFGAPPNARNVSEDGYRNFIVEAKDRP